MIIIKLLSIIQKKKNDQVAFKGTNNFLYDKYKTIVCDCRMEILVI